MKDRYLDKLKTNSLKKTVGFFPILSNVSSNMVSESRSYGLNTKDKQYQLENLKEEMLNKYESVQVKMDNLIRSKAKLKKNQILLNEKLIKLEEFYDFNMLKKEKAYLKIKQSRKSRHILTKELHAIQLDTKHLLSREVQFKDLINKMIKYRELIHAAIKLLSKDYVKASKDQAIEGLKSKFESLFHINGILITSMETKNQELKILKTTLIELCRDREVYTITAYDTLKQLYREKEFKKSQIEEKELIYYKKYQETRHKVKRFGILLLGLNNLANKCISTYKTFYVDEINHTKSIILKKMPWNVKIDKIKEYIMNNLTIFILISELIPLSPFIQSVIDRSEELNKQIY